MFIVSGFSRSEPSIAFSGASNFIVAFKLPSLAAVAEISFAALGAFIEFSSIDISSTNNCQNQSTSLVQ